MARSDQKAQVSPPSPADKEGGLHDFAAVLQRNLEDLFDLAHDHTITAAAPSADSGKVGDIILVDTGSSTKIYAKFPSGWKSVVLT